MMGAPREQRRGTASHLAYLSAAALLVACGHEVATRENSPTTASPPQPQTLSIELDIFSGRPNPTWTLTEPDSAELQRRLAGLHETQRDVDDLGLGYRGAIISGFPDTRICRVFRGLVLCSEPANERRFEDTRGAEDWLLDQAKQRGWRVPR